MTKRAFLFAGQGAQYLGMVRELYDQYELELLIFDDARHLLCYDDRDLVDEAEQKLTRIG